MRFWPQSETPAFGIIITGVLFALAFALHILFAALDWDILFSLVWVDLFVFSQFYGPISLFIGSPKPFDEKKNTVLIGSLIGSPLTVGFWFAVNERNFEPWLILTGLIPILIGFVVYHKINSNHNQVDETNTG